MRIEPINDRSLESDILLDVRAGRVWMLSRGRNAWHSTWVRHYQGETAMFTTLQSCKRSAENLRGQGNVFYATEAPAVVIVGAAVAHLIVDFHPDNPFGQYVPEGYTKTSHGVLRPGEPLSDVVSSFRHHSGHWKPPAPSRFSVRFGEVRNAEEVPRLDRRPLKTHSSFSQGGGYYLGWRTRPPRFSRRGINRLVKYWNDLTAGVDGLPDLLSGVRSADRARISGMTVATAENDRKMRAEIAVWARASLDAKGGSRDSK